MRTTHTGYSKYILAYLKDHFALSGGADVAKDDAEVAKGLNEDGVVTVLGKTGECAPTSDGRRLLWGNGDCSSYRTFRKAKAGENGKEEKIRTGA